MASDMPQDQALEQLSALLQERFPSFSADQCSRILSFYLLMRQENTVQNLTRLIEPLDFCDGHLVDVDFLLRSGVLRFPAMDLGSGGGVPGLLAAVISGGSWLLVDSEKRKAEFLSRAASRLGLSSVRTFGERAESVLRSERAEVVVARAVGTVSKICAWIASCSTWNTLILMKGPAWDEEWAEFQRSKWRKELRLRADLPYVVGPDQKKRRLIVLERVPRGT
jgi:16S rRNA (guanine527-N7)-methyltransferase